MIDDADFDKAHEIAKQIVAAWVRKPLKVATHST